MAPVDVVLDQARPVVLQRDLAFVVRERLQIARDKIYGAPDLVVEIFSPSGAVFDGTEKAPLYAEIVEDRRDILVGLVHPVPEMIELRVADSSRGESSFPRRDVPTPTSGAAGTIETRVASR